ncbi:MAG: cupredoxin domain-containing protein [Nitrososphaerales archaeon]
MSKAAATALVFIALISMLGAVTIANTAIAAQRPLAVTTTVTSLVSSQTPGQNQSKNIPGVVNQRPEDRFFTLTWELSPQADQDRFTPFNIIVAQGDTVHLTFVVNDTVAHTFTVGPPYNYQINVSAPGLVNDLTRENFTQNATNNSPGVKISGTEGNLTGTGSFVAKYSGVYEYFCVYHVQVGMFGYLTVLPNAGYTNSTVSTSTSNSTNAPGPGQVVIRYGSATNETTQSYYSPQVITAIIGQNNTVTWVNDDIAPHTVTSDATGQFDSGAINVGGSWSHTFTVPGSYTYHCSYHPWMHGTVIVKSA